MVAYEGSETAFLLRHRERLQIYPGVAAHIDRRVAALAARATSPWLLGGDGGTCRRSVGAARTCHPPRRILASGRWHRCPPVVPGWTRCCSRYSPPMRSPCRPPPPTLTGCSSPPRPPARTQAVRAMLAARGEGRRLVLRHLASGAASPIEHILVRRDATAAWRGRFATMAA
jgi:hypothetical protein